MIITKKTLQIKETVNLKTKVSTLIKKPSVSNTVLKKASSETSKINYENRNQKGDQGVKKHKNQEEIINQTVIQREKLKDELEINKIEEEEKTIQITPLLTPLKGNVIIKYNHYNSSFSISDGQLLKTDIDEKYAISFVFLGDFKLHLKAKEKTCVEETNDRFLNLIDKETYFLEIEEDGTAEAKRERKIYKAEPIPSICIKKERKNVELLTDELKNMDIEKIKDRDEDYKKLVEARDLEDILYE